MSDYDTPWKEILDAYLADFLAFFFPLVHAGIDWPRGYEPRNSELPPLTRDAEVTERTVDRVFKVWKLDGQDEWIAIHIEVQNQSDADFARLMFVYHYRLSDHHDRLHQQGRGEPEIKNLWRFIDWLMVLPTELEKRCWRELEQIERERRMPYMTSTERMLKDEGRQEGLRDSIATALELKFGPDSLELMPSIEAITDADRLLDILKVLMTATSRDDLRRLGI